MKQVRVKILPAIASPHGKWEILEFDEFILHYLPNLSLYISCTRQFPPFHILNEELLSGGADQGMSGGCFWKPFQLSESEYQEIFVEMITNPAYNLEYNESLKEIKSLNKWREIVRAKYKLRNKN